MNYLSVLWNAVVDFLVWLFNSERKPLASPTPAPIHVSGPEPVQGLLSTEVKCADVVAKIWPFLLAYINQTVDISKLAGLDFPLLLHVNSDLNYRIQSNGKGIKLVFGQSYPVIEAHKLLTIKADLRYVYLEKDFAAIGLAGLPEYIINFV